MEKILKIFTGIIKSVDEKEHTIDVIVSTDSVDRDQEKINLTAFKKRLASYKANPVLLSSHRYDDLTRAIGKAESIKVTQEGLRAKFKYFVGEGNKEADWGFFLATQGIAAYSIGFMAYAYNDLPRDEAEKAGYWREFTEVELLEVSQVLIPSNRDAVLGRSKEAEGIEKELCEMAIKSVDFSKVVTEEEKPAGETEPVEEKTSVSTDEIIASVKAELEVIKEMVKTLIDQTVTEKLEEVKQTIIGLVLESDAFKEKTIELIDDAIAQEKHYSNTLFGDAVSDLKHTPSSEEIKEAVKAGFNK